MLQLAAENGGRPDDPNKRDPLDFVLWQFSLPDEPAWESRWGPGRPGWHIECSALALRELGTTIDIHGGGRDLIFPHHECETAQSEAATGQPFVRHWVHTGLVGLEGTKMSKSLGNLVFVSQLLKEWEAPAVRLALLGHHYRHDWEWSTEDVATARGRLARWRAAPRPRSVRAAPPRSATRRSTTCATTSTTTSTRRGPSRRSTPMRQPAAPCAQRPPSWALPFERPVGDDARPPTGPCGTGTPGRRLRRHGEGSPMAGELKVRLPDGSSKDLPAGTTALGLAESIGPRLAKAAVAATVDGSEVDLATPLPEGAVVSIVTADSAGRPCGPAPLDRPCVGPGGAAAVAGGPLCNRPGDRGRLLLRLRAPRGCAFHRRGPGPHR